MQHNNSSLPVKTGKTIDSKYEIKHFIILLCFSWQNSFLSVTALCYGAGRTDEHDLTSNLLLKQAFSFPEKLRKDFFIRNLYITSNL